MCVYERYNSCAHKIKRKRVFKENRIGTPPQWQVAGAISSQWRRRLRTRITQDVLFFFFSPKPRPRCLKMTILSEAEIWYTRIPSEPWPHVFNDRLQKDTSDFSFMSPLLAYKKQ